MAYYREFFGSTTSIKSGSTSLPPGKFSTQHIDTSRYQNFSSTFIISIKQKNDNFPKKVSNAILKVVSKGQRTLNLDHLHYTDPDIDQDEGRLVYTVKAISTGKLIDRKNKSRAVNEFTQSEILNGNILFQHSGELKGRLAYSVSDSKHVVDGY